jgi:hypothetical protein
LAHRASYSITGSTTRVELLATTDVCHSNFVRTHNARKRHSLSRSPQLHAHDPIGVDLDQSLYPLDSTIDLCLSLFPWAKFRRRYRAPLMTASVLALMLGVEVGPGGIAEKRGDLIAQVDGRENVGDFWRCDVELGDQFDFRRATRGSTAVCL